MEKVSGGWRIATIALLVALCLLVVSVSWVASLGAKSIERETECLVNVCADDEYVSYGYDDYSQICQCFDKNGEVGKTEYMK